MLAPDYLDHAPDRLVMLWQQAEDDILRDVARRIGKMDALTPTANWQLWRYQQTEAVRKDMVKLLARYTGKSEAEIRRLMKEAATAALEAEDEIYYHYGKEPTPFEESTPLQNLLNAGYRQTAGSFSNLTATTANTVSGAFEQALMDEMGASFVEVTAHGGARPSHAVWQGRRYHRGGAVDYLGQHYEDFESATGYGTGAGLCGWNCRHTFFVVFPELGSPPAWTQESLEAFNARDIEYDGGLYTRYEISQMQRAWERAVRKWKRRYLAEDAAGADTTASTVKLRQARQSLAGFTRATGGRVDSARISVHGFGRSEASRASYVALKQERFNAANTELQQMREAGTIKAKGRLIESPSAPNEINFASDHVLQRWAERGMGPMDAERIIRSSKVAMSQRNGTQTCYYSELGFVAIGQDGNVSSIGPLDEGGKKLMEVVKKHGIPH